VRGPLSKNKLDYVCWLFARKKLDLFFLLDTQLSSESAGYIKREIKARLGMDTHIVSTDNKAPSTQQGVGGQMVICSSNIAKHIHRVKCDESGLGIFLGIGIRMQHSWFWAIGVYWPNTTAGNTGIKSLWNQYYRFLLGKLPLGTHIDVFSRLRNTLARLVTNCTTDPTNSIVIGGDWNLEQEQLSTWSDTLNLTNYLHKNSLEKYHTRRSGTSATCIDHILHNSTTTVSAGIINYAAFGRSDHFPIFNMIAMKDTFFISHQKHIKIKPVRRVELNRKDPRAIKIMNEQLENKFANLDLGTLSALETGSLLENNTRYTVQQVRGTMSRTPSPNKKMHDGWTPTYSVYFHQLAVFQEILRHLGGQHGRERWRTETQRREGILVYLNRWIETPNNYDFTTKEKIKNYSNVQTQHQNSGK
jgi:hypothetical protein